MTRHEGLRCHVLGMMRVRLAAVFLLVILLFVLPSRTALAQRPGNCPVPDTYRVRPGDSLSLIAERFGTDVPTLVRLNNIADPNHIEVGQVLRLPCPVTVDDQARAAAFAGMMVGVNLPQTSPVSAHLALWHARRQAYRAWQDLGISAALQWEPAIVRPGDTLVVRILPQAGEPITASVHIMDTWEPLVSVRRRYVGLVPLHGLVVPGMLRVRLGVQVSTGVTRTVELPVWVKEGGFPSQSINLPPDKSALLAPQVIQEEMAYLGKVWARAQGSPRWHGPFSWPLNIGKWPTTAPYGIRRTYNGGAIRGYHTGQDIAAPEGTPVYAPASGVVLLAEPLQVRGNAVVLSHGAGVTSNYWHLSKIAVQAGQKVKRGDLLGWVGTTGLSTGAHLHWEMRVFGVPVNPVPWTRAPGPATFWTVSSP